jgi:putative Mg2+ transporter-C (MgtC) family protein
MFEGFLPDLGKLLFAAFLGGVIGFERESHGQAAGFRTYLIVSTGACLMMLLSLHIEQLYHTLDVSQTVVRLDPARVASYAIASMGFLGAGAIIKGRGTVRGLTTAAGLWLVTGMGLAVGAGQYASTLFATIIILIALYLLHPIRELAGRRIYSILSVKYRGETDPLEEIKSMVAAFPQLAIQHINLEQEIPSRTILYAIRLYSKENKAWKELVKKISLMQGIIEIKWEESDVP